MSHQLTGSERVAILEDRVRLLMDRTERLEDLVSLTRIEIQ
jgi:hypothetical protein